MQVLKTSFSKGTFWTVNSLSKQLKPDWIGEGRPRKWALYDSSKKLIQRAVIYFCQTIPIPAPNKDHIFVHFKRRDSPYKNTFITLIWYKIIICGHKRPPLFLAKLWVQRHFYLFSRWKWLDHFQTPSRLSIDIFDHHNFVSIGCMQNYSVDLIHKSYPVGVANTYIIMALRSSILQAETCQILS